MTKTPDTRGQVQITDPAVMDALRVAAAERDVSVSWLTTRLIREALPRLIPVDQLFLTRDNHPPVKVVDKPWYQSKSWDDDGDGPVEVKVTQLVGPAYDDGDGPPWAEHPVPMEHPLIPALPMRDSEILVAQDEFDRDEHIHPAEGATCWRTDLMTYQTVHEGQWVDNPAFTPSTELTRS